ncbi:MAG: DUF3883 domain-containing protein [Solirubrobacterales bacterium]
MSFSPTSPEPGQPPSWAAAGGLPSAYVIRAALHAAALIDAEGSIVGQARESYWHKATGGEFSAANLRIGEELLLDTGLLVERGGRLQLTKALEELLEGSIDDATAAVALEASSLWGLADELEPTSGLEVLVPDARRREELLIARARRFDDRRRRLIGEIGEEVVLTAARQELTSLNRGDLARRVRRVSLDSDALGYDISAPRLVGEPRLLEVKATTGGDQPTRIHLSRNEARVGATYPDWSLVVCSVPDPMERVGEIRGWCHAASFQARLPSDAEGGRWESAELEIWPAELLPNLPPATL